LIYTAGPYQSRIDSAPAGQTYVQLLTPSDVSIFTVGKRVEIAGFETQKSGQPINPQYYEYPIITAIDSNPVSPTYGKISLNQPLKWRYNKDWPDFTPGVVPSGQPYIYLTTDNQVSGVNGGTWDCVQVYNGIGLENWDALGAAFMQFSGYDVTIIGGYATRGCPICSCCYNYVVDGTDLSTCNNSEFDKQVVNATWRNLTSTGFTCQSPSPDVLTLDNI
jgi:hypothetical protein